MPEIITKYPDVTKQVLESAGARCGRGEPQQILTECPRDRFCAFPGGEVCIFGLDEVPKMTQVGRAELCGAAAGPVSLADFGSGAGSAALVLAVAVVAWRRHSCSPGRSPRSVAGPGTGISASMQPGRADTR